MKIEFPQKANGLHILSKSDFETLAHDILKEKQPEALTKAMPLDVKDLIEEKLCLEIQEAHLSKDGNILGLISFTEQNIPTYDENYLDAVLPAQEGTIIIEQNLKANEARYRFTEMHEASHWMLHRKFYSPMKKNYSFRRQDNTFIACRDNRNNKKKKNEPRSDYEWSEWQADCLAAALLMPSATFINAAKILMKQYGYNTNKLTMKYIDARPFLIINELAELYNVSKLAVEIRMKTLNLLAY